MRDKDAILLEEAYGLIFEMGKNLSYTRRLAQDRETRTSRAQSEEEQQKRIIKAQFKISQLFKQLATNKDDIVAATDIYATVKDALSTRFGEFGPFEEQTEEEVETEDESEDESDETESEPRDTTKREEFYINGQEMTWKDVFQKILDDTITDFHDYRKLLPHVVGDTKRDGLTIDGFMNEKIYEIDPVTGSPKLDPVTNKAIVKNKTEADKHLIRKFYHLYELILRDLDTEVKPRSRREKPGHWEFVYYFDSAGNPIQTQIRVPEDGKVPTSFGHKNKFMNKSAPPPQPYGRYNPRELRGKTIDEIKTAVKNDEAYKAFVEKYPPDEEDENGNLKWAKLYRRGQQKGGYV